MDIEEVVIEESYYERRVVDGSGGKETQGATAFEESLEWDAEDEDDAYLDGWDDDFESDDVCEDLSELYESSHNKALGKRGERAAARYLERMNYIVLERNWKCPFGEADIIALDESTLVFVEVKTRTSIAKGFPSEAVDARKRARYEKIAAW